MDNLNLHKQAIQNKNKMSGLMQPPAFMPQPQGLFAFGGDAQTHGADFPTGLMHIDAGGSHESNPNDGVQMGVDSEGTPNLVEEGEVVFNDYVFSNRINIDDQTKALLHFPKKKDITYADAAKKLENEIKERPNDPISEAGFKAQMQKLEEQQERQKADMEAARAREAFEALSPEEQTAVMQQAAQQEAMQQEAMLQQAQQPQGQVSPEEAAMAQQQMMQADGSQAMIGQEPQMAACGGKLYDKGGDLKKLIYKLTGSNTDSDFDKWTKLNKVDATMDWEDMLKDGAFTAAISRDNPALADAIKKGYDFGAYKPEGNGKATIQSISKGNWKTTNGKGWRGSEDLAFKQATEGLSDAEIDALTTEQLAERMRNTEAYKNTNKWLENSDNALMYLNTLMNDPDTPQMAKDYAAKFVKEGKWKDGFNYDYATVFGSNGKGVRETNPGTYWHTAMEANRGNQMGNLVINDDGSVEEIVGDVPADWTSEGSYTWATPENDLTYNYYRRPAAASAEEVVPAPTTTPATTLDGRTVAPNLKNEKLRYMGLLGPAVGLGLQLAGVGKPDYSGLDAAVERAGDVALASYQPLGDYLTYRPMDIWYEQNRLNANARATDRAILNSGANQGSKTAALLASGYNDQIASGDLYRKALEYNDALRQQVAGFNRGTNQFNAEQFGQTSRFNASARNQANQAATSARLNAAAQKLDADAGWYNGIYGNISGLFKGISDLGRENAQHNMIARMSANGLYGTATPDTPVFQDFLKWQEEQKKSKKKSKGGKNHKKHDIIL